MKPHTLTAGLLLLVGCDGERDDHDHSHGHAAPAAPQAAAATSTSPPQQGQVQVQPLGRHQARLASTPDGLRLVLTDPLGAAVPPAGEVRVVLTGTDREEQRVVLRPSGEGWTGAARPLGAAGDVAVVLLEVDGHTETARFAWGEAPSPAPAHPAPADDNPEDEDAHGHGHGHGH